MSILIHWYLFGVDCFICNHKMSNFLNIFSNHSISYPFHKQNKKNKNKLTNNFKSNCSSWNTWLWGHLLEGDWRTSGYTLKENWHTIFQHLTIVNYSTARPGIVCPPPFHDEIFLAWSCTGFVHAAATCMSSFV